MAGGSVSIAVSGPEGYQLCPQVLFGAWRAGDPLTPAALEAEIIAEEEAEAEDEEEEPEGCDE